MSVWDGLTASRACAGLAAQVASGDISHAWLLAGPEGSGKRAAARALAAAINCEREPNRGCGGCSRCLRIARDRFPDVHHIAPEGPLIPVDTIRDAVLPEAARSAFEGDFKVFVIEEADRMNPAAQNALLKTLEEPHPGTIFVLLSAQDEEILETIRSRCRVVRLEPLDEDEIRAALEREGAPGATALLAARLAEGNLQRARALAFDDDALRRRGVWTSLPRRLTSPLDALDLAPELLVEARDAVKARERVQRQEVADLADALGEARGTASARNALARRHKRQLRRLEEEILGEALQTLGSFYRDVLALRRGGEEGITNIDLLDELRQWAAADVADADLVVAVERCVEARAALLKNANQTLQIEALLLDLARLAPPFARVG